MTTSDFIISKLPKTYKKMYKVLTAEVFSDHTVSVAIEHTKDVRNSTQVIIKAGSVTNDFVSVSNIKSLVREHKLNTLFS